MIRKDFKYILAAAGVAALLAGCGEVINLTSKLSGAVPQISVITGTCLGTNALAAAGADFVIMTEDAKLSLDVTGANAGAACNAENGGASIIAADTDEAVQKARELLCYLPSNNLTSAPEAEALDPSPEGSCMVSKIVDGGSKFKIADSCGKTGRIRLARMGGSVVGVVRTIGKKLDENGEALGGAVIGLFKTTDTDFTAEAGAEFPTKMRAAFYENQTAATN